MILNDDLAQLASDQLGLLARRQVVAVLGRSRADHLLDGPAFRRVRRGVYELRGGARHPCQAAVASTLRAGGSAILTGPAALRLLDLEGVALGDHGAVLVPAGCRVGEVGAPMLRDRSAERRTWRLGEVHVATPPDALLESCLVAPPPPVRQLRLAHDRLRWTGHLAPGVLGTRRDALRLPVDDARLRTVLDLDGQVSTGDGERHLGRLLARFDPPPRAQVWITPHRCVDWYFAPLLLGVEYQGGADHDHDLGRRRDRVRDDELDLAGVRLVYVTAADLRNERGLLARLAAAVAVRADELGQPAPVLRPQPVVGQARG